MKYIFVAGAPGSKWSSVVKNIYYSPDIDQSDYRDEWTYYHDASGRMELMHLGAYFDPGMECNLPEYFNGMRRGDAEAIFNRPFTSGMTTRTRIIKSHVFSYKENLQYLRDNWPDLPIVLVHRGDDACLGWWVKCGHFDITYPKYHEYYKNLREMAGIIKRQNNGILDAWWSHRGAIPQDNRELAKLLKIESPPNEYQQDYAASDVRIMVI